MESVMSHNTSKDILQSGTGSMLTLSEAIKEFEKQGYTENIVPKYDHLECKSGEVIAFPKDFEVDCMRRIENSSDPDDQCILYAISMPGKDCKGLYVESYGLYHDELSTAMLDRLKQRATLCP